MNGWLIFLGSIGIIFVIIWFTSVRIQIVYKREAENDRLEIEVSAYKRLLRYRFTVNLLQIQSLSKGVKVSQKPDVGKASKWITPHTVYQWQQKFRRLLRNVHDLRQILREVLKSVHGEVLEWRTHIGLGEASATGAVVGAVWTVKSAIVALLAQYISLYARPKLDVWPDFQREMLEIYFLCILRLRVGYAIIAVIRIAVHYLQKGRERVWENIRFKA
jgi:hypothetical protein